MQSQRSMPRYQYNRYRSNDKHNFMKKRYSGAWACKLRRVFREEVPAFTDLTFPGEVKW
jgi:hypothetical protein